jgi:hypothetical protein
MLTTAKRLPFALVAVLLALLAYAPRSASADAGDYRLVEGGVVYLGNGRLFSRPCVIQADLVYRQIAEYREILEKGLTDKDVRYHFLMKKASERFVEAVKRMARELNQDLVGELGAIKSAKAGVAEPLERTDDVITRLG